MQPKDFYKHYLADNNTVTLNKKLVNEIMSHAPAHVFEFGCGTGKNLALIHEHKENLPVTGLDISLINVINSHVKNGIRNVMLGDETHLRHFANYDVVFTCSVLDHIEKVDDIVNEFKRICNKAVVIAECVDHEPSNFYWKHDYEAMGFVLVKDSYYYSESDRHNYYIYRWTK